MQSEFESIKKELDKFSLRDRLIIISNLLFDTYGTAKEFDTLYKNLDLPDLKLINNFSELEETYAFNQDAYVFRVLDKAHDLLVIADDLK